ncbi:MAG TPA: PucR family transcriptional regulator ligand-binding domain-containing protein [Streptomyces sp.]|nr:PucR family transcriptional regulator ligand-binding domain-containing protein [Streptomyces sp.]
MALTVADVLAMEGLELGLLAGGSGLHRTVRWAHATELVDPVPWLRGGELVLTVGLGLPEGPEGRREYVRRLSDAGCAGLGFAAEVLDALPADVLEEADRRGLAVIGVLGRTPFIAITEAVARWHTEERTRAERHAIKVQEAMARAALRSGPGGILTELARGVGGETLLMDVAGRPTTARPRADCDWHAEAARLVADISGRRAQGAIAVEHGGRYLMVQSLGLTGPPRGWLALSCPGGDKQHQRLLSNHAAVLLAIDMLGVRASRAKAHEQRSRVFAGLLNGDPLVVASAGRLEELCPLPAPPFEVVSLRSGGDSGPDLARTALDALTDVIGDAAVEERVLLHPTPSGLVVVLPDVRPRLGPRLTDRLAELTGSKLRAGGSTAHETAELAAAVRRASELAAAGAVGYTHADDIGAWTLLRDAVAPEGVRRFTDAVVGRLHAHDQRNGTRLAASLRAYLEAAGNLEAAASALGVHRNTLRARLRTAERVSRRSLAEPRDRLELWLALSADDLLAPG